MEETVFQNQMIIFNLLSVIAKVLTGKTPSIKHRLQDGSYITITPNIDNVTWEEENVQASYQLLKESAKY